MQTKGINWCWKSLTFLALSAAIRQVGGMCGVVGHVPGIAVSSPRRRRRVPGPTPERGCDTAHAGALLHRRRRRRRGEPHAEQPHPSVAGAGGAGARVVAVVAAVRALPCRPLWRGGSSTWWRAWTRGLCTCDEQQALQMWRRALCFGFRSRLTFFFRWDDILGVFKRTGRDEMSIKSNTSPLTGGGKLQQSATIQSGFRNRY